MFKCCVYCVLHTVIQTLQSATIENKKNIENLNISDFNAFHFIFMNIEKIKFVKQNENQNKTRFPPLLTLSALFSTKKTSEFSLILSTQTGKTKTISIEKQNQQKKIAIFFPV